MSYHSRLAYDIWERENYYAEDDFPQSDENPEELASASPSDQKDTAPLAA